MFFLTATFINSASRARQIQRHNVGTQQIDIGLPCRAGVRPARCALPGKTAAGLTEIMKDRRAVISTGHGGTTILAATGTTS
jgi:hypothetical protein